MKVILVMMMSLLFSCGSDKELPQAKKSSAVFDAQLKAIDKAKGVEQMLQKSVDDRDQKMRDKGA